MVMENSNVGPTISSKLRGIMAVINLRLPGLVVVLQSELKVYQRDKTYTKQP